MIQKKFSKEKPKALDYNSLSQIFLDTNETEEKTEDTFYNLNIESNKTDDFDLTYIQKPWESNEIIRQPKFKHLLRKQKEDERKNLIEDIKQRGCITPLVAWFQNGKYILIDGFNRDEICCELKIPYYIRVEFFETEEDVKVFIIKNQLGRRNLNTFEKAYLAVQLKEVLSNKAKINQGKRYDLLNNTEIKKEAFHTLKELSKITGVSTETINKVENITKKALPIIANKVKNNEISVNTGYELSKLDFENQKIISQLSNKEIKDKAQTLRITRKDNKNACLTDTVEKLIDNIPEIDINLDKSNDIVLNTNNTKEEICLIEKNNFLESLKNIKSFQKLKYSILNNYNFILIIENLISKNSHLLEKNFGFDKEELFFIESILEEDKKSFSNFDFKNNIISKLLNSENKISDFAF